MTKFTVFAAALFAVASAAAQTHAPVRELLSAPTTVGTQSTLPGAQRQAGKSRGRVDHALLRELKAGEQFGFTPQGRSQATYVVERTVEHANGDRTIVARLQAAGETRRAIVTTGAGGSVGRLDTADGRFDLLAENGDAEIADYKALGRRIAPPRHNDARVPPGAAEARARAAAEAAAIGAASSTTSAPTAAALIPSGNSVIDLLVLTSPKMATRYPGSLLATRINNVVEVGNQAYLNSQIKISLRVVKVQAVNYGDAQTMDTALNALTSGSGVLSGVASLRTQYGADLVTLIRPYDGAVDDGCGLAWLLDYDNPVSFSRSHAMSVVSDGDDLQAGSLYYCPDNALVHEIGHNLGSAHDRANSLDGSGALMQGTYPYSFGHGVEGIFGTIMSYIDPGVDLFSNPRIQCNGRPCGVAVGSAGEADNATSMNNTRTAVAAFLATAVPLVSAANNDLLVDFGGSIGLWLRRNDSTWLQVHSVSAGPMAAGEVDNNGRSDVLIDLGGSNGLWTWKNGSTWAKVHNSAAAQIVASDLDNNGQADFVVNFGTGLGLWAYMNDGTWKGLHAVAPRQVASGNLDSDARRDLVVDFGAQYGIWQYMNNGSWVPLHGTSAQDIVTGDLDGNGIDEVIIDFGPQYGLWVRMNQASWVQLHGVSPQRMVVGNIDADPRKDLVVDFGPQYGIWVWKNNSTWQGVHAVASEALEMADLDRNGVDDLIVDFGSQYGLWAWKNGATWVQQHGSSPRKFISLDTDGQ